MLLKHGEARRTTSSRLCWGRNGRPARTPAGGSGKGIPARVRVWYWVTDGGDRNANTAMFVSDLELRCRARRWYRNLRALYIYGNDDRRIVIMWFIKREVEEWLKEHPAEDFLPPEHCQEVGVDILEHCGFHL